MLIYWVHRWMDYREEETSCKRRMMESVHLKAISCFWFFWCLCLLPIAKRATLLFPVLLTVTLCLSTHEPRNNRAKWPWTETSDTVSQNKLFKLCSRVFRQGNRKANTSRVGGDFSGQHVSLYSDHFPSLPGWINCAWKGTGIKNKLLKGKIGIPIEKVKQ